MFGAGSTPAAFGATPAVLVNSVNSSQPTLATPAPTTPATTFDFGTGLTPAAPPNSGFETAPSFGFGNNTPQPAAPPVPSIPDTFGFGGNPAATPNPTSGFVGGNPSFAATPSFMGAVATPSTLGGGGGGAFSKTPLRQNPPDPLDSLWQAWKVFDHNIKQKILYNSVH